MKTAHVLSLAVSGALTLLASRADAEPIIIDRPDQHDHYVVELEPHGLLAWDSHYAGDGFGLGGRVSIPVMRNGFVRTINNNVAVSFGFDWAHYGSCDFAYAGVGYACGADFFEFPIVLQWNFFLTRSWSVFGEPGLALYHGDFDTAACSKLPNGACAYPTATSLDPAFWIGGRYRFNNNVALTMRIGYPNISVGVSFFP